MTTTMHATDTAAPAADRDTDPRPAPSPVIPGPDAVGSADAPVINGELADRLLRSARWQQ